MKVKETNNGNSVIFPQANDIYKVIGIIELIDCGIVSEDVILKEIGMTSLRQVHYYKAAGCFLGLLDNKGKITLVGKLIIRQSKIVQFELLVYLILGIDIFKEYYLSRNQEETIHRIMKDFGYNRTTANRRMNTLIQWIQWCDIIISDYNVEVQFI